MTAPKKPAAGTDLSKAAAALTSDVKTPVDAKKMKAILSIPVRICKSFHNIAARGVKWECEEHENPVPIYKTKMAAGADLFCTETHTLMPGQCADIPAGIALEIPEGWEGEIRGRSGHWFNNRLMGFNGTIDADYRDEIKVSIINLGDHPVTVKPGFRIGQILFHPVVQAEFALVEELEDADSDRVGGMGSTGE